MTEAVYPVWPTPGQGYPTRERALVATLLVSDDGDRIVIHQSVCGCRWELACDCDRTVLVVQEGRA